MRRRTIACSLLLLLGLAGCYGRPGDRDTGWCCNRPVSIPCEGCTSLLLDPIEICRPRCAPRTACCPGLPGEIHATVRHNHNPMPPPGAVLAVPARP
jgi:hypothetical protein